MRKHIVGLLAVSLALTSMPVCAVEREELFSEAIHVLEGMEEKTAAVRLCGAGLLEKGKETKIVFEKMIETCACCADAFRCCYALACRPCLEVYPDAAALKELDDVPVLEKEPPEKSP
jgi:hypothetical protein